MTDESMDEKRKQAFEEFEKMGKTRKNASEKVTPLKRGSLSYRQGTSIQPEKIEWLMDQMFPLGEVSMIAGDQGVGKSTLLMKLVAHVTTGEPFKAGCFNLVIPHGNVAILSSEDKAETILKPRIIAAGGDENNFYIIEGEKETDVYGIQYEEIVQFDRDIGRLHETLTKIGNVKLVIVDPITSYLGDIDDNKSKDVRLMINKLTAVARNHNCCILLNTHLSKGSSGKGGKALHRVMGSIAYTAASRAVYLVERHDVSPKTKRKVVPFKNNYGDDQNGFAYEIELVKTPEGFPVTRVNLLDELVTDTANDLLGDEDERLDKTERGRARQFLFNLLKHGSKTSKEVKKMASEYDLSERSIQRARSDLKIIIEKSGTNRSETIWYLSSQSPDEA